MDGASATLDARLGQHRQPEHQRLGGAQARLLRRLVRRLRQAAPHRSVVAGLQFRHRDRFAGVEERERRFRVRLFLRLQQAPRRGERRRLAAGELQLRQQQRRHDPKVQREPSDGERRLPRGAGRRHEPAVHLQARWSGGLPVPRLQLSAGQDIGGRAGTGLGLRASSLRRPSRRLADRDDAHEMKRDALGVA